YNMKKVGIITQHRVVNYGSMLQTYALQEKIEELGYKCEVIDYYPERFTPVGMLKRIKTKSIKLEKSLALRTIARMVIIPSYYIKKVGIITQHRVVNYGSMLQTYALQEKIEELGYKCEVIDYYPERFTPVGMLKRIKTKSIKLEKSRALRTIARMVIIPSYFI